MSPRCRHSVAALAAGAAIGALACGAGRAAQPGPGTADRPNIILILTDDLDLTPVPHMPWLRSQLTARGVSFTNAFVTDSVCAPSRVSILTGQYVHGHGVIDNPPPHGGFRRWYRDGGEASTIATWLRDAGYRTALIGKYVNYYPQASNAQYVPPGWSDWNGLFFQESYYQFKMNRNGRIVDYGTTESDYQTDVLHQQTLEFLESTRPDQPFFLHLSFYAPHAPQVPADRHQGLFPELEAPRPESFDEEDVSDKPAWVREQPRLEEDVIEGIDEWFRNRVRMLQSVDESIAGIVRTLEERGQLENTWIFFTSDNGFQQGAHRLDHGKGDAYEDSIRVPLVVRGPGVPRNVRLEHFALNIDLAPTFADLAGAEVPDFVDGVSLVPLLGDDPIPLEEWRTDFLVEHWTPRDGGLPEYAALRTTKHLYVEYAAGERELYDMTADPGQQVNLLAGLELDDLTLPPVAVAPAATGTLTAATATADSGDAAATVDPSAAEGEPATAAPGTAGDTPTPIAGEGAAATAAPAATAEGANAAAGVDAPEAATPGAPAPFRLTAEDWVVTGSLPGAAKAASEDSLSPQSDAIPGAIPPTATDPTLSTAADPTLPRTLSPRPSRALVEWLSARLAALRTCKGESCRKKPPPLVATAPATSALPATPAQEEAPEGVEDLEGDAGPGGEAVEEKPAPAKRGQRPQARPGGDVLGP